MDKTFYLTFDGAPDPPNTYRLLDVLKKHGVKATFFMEGHRVDREPECGRAVLSAGHSFGNHTYTHTPLDGLSFEASLKEVEDCDRALWQRLSAKTRLVRPPFGTITQEFSNYLQSTGREVVLWSISVKDWLGPDAQAVADRIVEQLTENVVTCVLHDYLSFNPDVIDIAIPRIKAAGYAFATYAP